VHDGLLSFWLAGPGHGFLFEWIFAACSS
jgi:hypothetical protein